MLALEAGKLDEALALLADDVEYTNVSLPTVRGRAGIERLLRPALEKLHLGFRLHCHTIATSGPPGSNGTGTYADIAERLSRGQAKFRRERGRGRGCSGLSQEGGTSGSVTALPV